MSATRSAASPAQVDDPPWSEADEAAMVEAVHAILPEIDFDDPVHTEYLRQAIQEALDDPRPSISSEEMTRRLDKLFRGTP